MKSTVAVQRWTVACASMIFQRSIKSYHVQFASAAEKRNVQIDVPAGFQVNRAIVLLCTSLIRFLRYEKPSVVKLLNVPPKDTDSGMTL
jgi:hypothetical protein